MAAVNMVTVRPCVKDRHIWEFDDAEAGKPPAERRDALAFDELLAKSDKVDISKTLKGLVVSFPFADGYAHYKVVRDDAAGVVLEHIPYGDAWRLHGYAEHGLSREDIRETALRRRNLIRASK